MAFSMLDINERYLLHHRGVALRGTSTPGAVHTTWAIVTCRGLQAWVMWDIYEWYLLFHCGAVLRGMGTFWKRSVSLFLLGVLLVSGFLLVVVLGFADLFLVVFWWHLGICFAYILMRGNGQSKQKDWWPSELLARTAPAKKKKRLIYLGICFNSFLTIEIELFWLCEHGVGFFWIDWQEMSLSMGTTSWKRWADEWRIASVSHFLHFT